MTPHYFFINNCNHARISRDMITAIVTTAITNRSMNNTSYLVSPVGQTGQSYDLIFYYINHILRGRQNTHSQLSSSPTLFSEITKKKRSVNISAPDNCPQSGKLFCNASESSNKYRDIGCRKHERFCRRRCF